jgi:hypothetical protein
MTSTGFVVLAAGMLVVVGLVFLVRFIIKL